MSNLSNDDLLSAQSFMAELSKSVCEEEGRLSSEGRDIGPGGTALQRLDETRIHLGSPRDNLTRLTPKLFEGIGISLNDLQKKQLATRNFYYMTVTVNFVPGTGVQFNQVKLELDFTPKGEKEPLVHSLFPTSEWKEVLSWSGGLNLGLNADLSWGVGLDMENLPEAIKAAKDVLPGEISASINNKNDYKAFIAIPEFTYKMGRAEIEATGEGNTFCYWNIQKPELRETQTAQFGMVFKTPKTVKKVTLTGKVKAETYTPWLVASLRNVFANLKKEAQERLKEGIPLGDLQTWDLKLPL